MTRDEQEFQELCRFGYQLLSLQVCNILAAAAIGLAFSCLKEMMMFLISYIPLRSYAGGYHADSPVRCGVINIAIELAVAAAFWQPMAAGASKMMLAGAVFCGIIICMAAPVAAKNKPLTDSQVISFRRKARIILGVESVGMAGLYIAGFRELSAAVALCHIIVAGLLMAGKFRKAEPDITGKWRWHKADGSIRKPRRNRGGIGKQMFWNKFRKAPERPEDHSEEKDESWLRITYGAFASKNPETVRLSGCALGGMLKHYDMKKMMRLSETFHQSTSMEWYQNWDTVRPDSLKKWLASEDDYRYVVILGSFHPNGYYREKCLSELESCKDTLPFIILRMNDWVERIRRRAVSAACRRIRNCSVEELLCAGPAMDKIRRSGRRRMEDLSETERLMKVRLTGAAGDIPATDILQLDFEARKSAYRCLFSGRILDREKAGQLLAREKHSFCQSLIITGILKYYDCPMEQIDGYLKHKNSCVRKKALEYKYEVLKNTWTGLEDLLLDSSRGVREFAAFILEYYEAFDTLDFYVEHLKDGDPVVPIMEIGARGDRELKDLLMPFLSHPRERVVRCAIIAVGKLAGMEMQETLWDFLLDRRPSVAKAAYVTAVKNGIRFGSAVLYDAILRDDTDGTKRCLINLLGRENCWERTPYLLRLLKITESEELRDGIIGGLRRRSLYGSITEAQCQAVIQALDECKGCLPLQMAEEVRFDLKFVRWRPAGR